MTHFPIPSPYTAHARQCALVSSRVDLNTSLETPADVVYAFLNARYYDGGNAKFLSQDPLVNALGGGIKFDSNTVTADGRTYKEGLSPSDTNVVLATFKNANALNWKAQGNDEKAWEKLGVTAGVLVDPQMLNSYAYSRNNPVGLKDPSGLWGMIFTGNAGAEGGVGFGRSLIQYVSI